MRHEEGIEFYLNAMINEGLYPNKRDLRFHMSRLFRGVDFKNKRFIDIGGGNGLYCFYAACRGAQEAVCLEPAAEGSSSADREKFHKALERTKYGNLTLEPLTLEQFESHGKTFDIILLHNSINHLDETACISLLSNDNCRAAYQKLFEKISSLSKKNAKLIVCDCSRYNFFALLGIRNPIRPNIEWHKHQAPSVWAALLRKAGFENPCVRWSSFNRLGPWGNIVFGNKLIAYFLKSHFCLTMDKL